MTILRYKFLPVEMILAVGLVICGTSLAAAQQHQAAVSEKADPSQAATNAAPAQSAIPQSVFIVPTTPTDGKDPFFPKLTQYASAPARRSQVGEKPAVSTSVDLSLKGISGPPNRRMVIINDYTFMAGEEANVTAGNSRVRVRCVEIKQDSVIIEVGGERKELRLRVSK